MASQDPNRYSNDRQDAVLAVDPQAAATGVQALRQEDVVFDFDGLQPLDLMGLTMVLTAQRVADENEVTVWLKGMPERAWSLLEALGVDLLFARFPEASDHPD